MSVERSVEIATVGANVTSYLSTGLTAGTSYSYRVRAFNAVGPSDYSNVATVGIPLPPVGPTELTVTAASSSQIDLAWMDNSDNEDGFRIERCTGAGCTSFTQIATVGPNVTAYLNTVALNTSYSYRVRAYNVTGTSAYSNVAPSSPPPAPTNLTATPVSGTQINLNWVDNATDEAAFSIEQCSGVGCSPTVFIGVVGANVTSVQRTGLVPGTSYSYRVRAYNAAGISAYSNTATATTSAPAAPTNLAATPVSGTQINLSWVDNATNEAGFRIEQCQGAGCSGFVEIATVGTPNWVQPSPSGTPPVARYGHSAVFDATSNRMVVFGGWTFTTGFTNEAWVLSDANAFGSQSAWARLESTSVPPVSRVSHTATYSPASNRMTLFGGYDGSVRRNDVWVLTQASRLP
jgi:hypothetical protein